MTYQPPTSPDPYGQPHDPYGQSAPNPYAQPPVSGDPYSQQPPAYGQQYPQTPYASAAPAGGNNGMAIGAMVTGIVSLLLSCCCNAFSLPISATAIVLGVISRKQIAQRGQTNGGMALTGIITGAVAVVIALTLFVLSLSGAFDTNYYNDFSNWD